MASRLAGYLAAYRVRMAAVLAAMLATAGIEMLSPWPLKIVVDNVVGQHPLRGIPMEGSARTAVLVLAALSYVALAGLGGGLGVLYDRWLTVIIQRVGLALSSDLYAQVQRLSLRFHDQARVGDMVTRITGDVDQLQESFVSGLSLLSIDLVMVFGIAVIMFLADWKFALVALLVVPPLLLTFSILKGRVREASQVVRSSEGAMASLAQETLASIRVVKAFGQEERERERFLHQSRAKAEATIRAVTWEGVFAFLVDFITAVGVAVVLGYGGWRVIHGDLTLGLLVLFMQYLHSLYGPLRGFGRLTGVVQKASASAERIEELFRAAPEVPEAPHAKTLGRAHGWIVFDEVWFEYDPAHPVLRGLNLEIRPGEVLALMGPTGAGKSTLASLVPRFYDPTRGRILLDATDIREFRVRSLREQIAIVLQDSILFAGTIRNNIAYGRPAATDREVMAAAQAAHAHEFIAELPEGFETAVGERGVTLSGGQRQRIAIARALLKDAPILILDEPTSAVDVESEGLIVKALARLMEGRTVLVITHRLSLTTLAGRIATMTAGMATPGATPAEVDVRRLRQPAAAPGTTRGNG